MKVKRTVEKNLTQSPVRRKSRKMKMNLRWMMIANKEKVQVRTYLQEKGKQTTTERTQQSEEKSLMRNSLSYLWQKGNYKVAVL